MEFKIEKLLTKHKRIAKWQGGYDEKENFAFFISIFYYNVWIRDFFYGIQYVESTNKSDTNWSRIVRNYCISTTHIEEVVIVKIKNVVLKLELHFLY